VFPAVARRVVALEDRGAERRVAPPVKCARLGGRARPLGEGNAAPFGAPHGVGRPAGGSPFDGAVPALALGVAGIGSELNRVGSLCPRADPRAARAPCLQGTKAQAPHPAPPTDASGGALE
jgi:hypothetical protein